MTIRCCVHVLCTFMISLFGVFPTGLIKIWLGSEMKSQIILAEESTKVSKWLPNSRLIYKFVPGWPLTSQIGSVYCGDHKGGLAFTLCCGHLELFLEHREGSRMVSFPYPLPQSCILHRVRAGVLLICVWNYRSGEFRVVQCFSQVAVHLPSLMWSLILTKSDEECDK